MAIAEKLGNVNIRPNAVLEPSQAIMATLAHSNVDEIISELVPVLAPTIGRRVIEDGNRLVVSLDWETEGSPTKRVALSIRGNTIAFIGGTNQFTRLSGEELGDRELVETTFAQAILNPLLLDPVSE